MEWTLSLEALDNLPLEVIVQSMQDQIIEIS